MKEIATNMLARLTEEQVIERFTQIHGDLYDYSKMQYISQSKPITIICKVHGEFNQLPMNHWKGHGCFECSYFHRAASRRKLLSQWVEEANHTHDNLYDYSEAIQPKSGKSKASIKCAVHGVFHQTWINHIHSKQGCPKCATYGRYSHEWFESNPKFKEAPSILYLVKFTSEDESFYKIGITRRSLDKRWGKKLPYHRETLCLREAPLYDNFVLENMLLTNYLYKIRKPPSNRIGGDQECFICDDNMLEFIVAQISRCNSSEERQGDDRA